MWIIWFHSKKLHESGAFQWSSEKNNNTQMISLQKKLLLQYQAVQIGVKDQETPQSGFQPTVVIKTPMPRTGQASKSNGA